MSRGRVPRWRRRNPRLSDRPRVEDIEAGCSEPGFDAPEHSRHLGRRDRVCHHVGIIARIQLAQYTTCRQTGPLLTNSPDADPPVPPPGYVYSRVSASINATGTQGVVSQLPTLVALRQGSSRDPGARGHVGGRVHPEGGPPTIVRPRQLRSLAAHGGYPVHAKTA